MKTKLLKSIVVLLLSVGSFSCGDTQEEQTFKTLNGTQWYLLGYVNTQTGEMINEDFYGDKEMRMLEFYGNGKGTAYTLMNTIAVDLQEKLVFGINTSVDDSHNGHLKLFYEAIKTANSYTMEGNRFKIFYNNKKNYLLYKRIEL